MRRLTLLLSGIAALWPSLLLAVQVGDSHEDVVAELGRPAGQMGAGSALILTYPNQIIRLESGKVVSIKPTAPASPARPPAPTGTSRKQPAVTAPPLAWTTDYRAALEQAAGTQRIVFLFFTGSDWCGWCKKFDAEILETTAFRAYAAQKLILVKLDFPRTFKLPEHVVAQNRALTRKYRVDGYPTVMVLGPDGKTLGNLGYQPGGPDGFIRALIELEAAASPAK